MLDESTWGLAGWRLGKDSWRYTYAHMNMHTRTGRLFREAYKIQQERAQAQARAQGQEQEQPHTQTRTAMGGIIRGKAFSDSHSSSMDASHMRVSRAAVFETMWKIKIMHTPYQHNPRQVLHRFIRRYKRHTAANYASM